jgi:hypothetical protein
LTACALKAVPSWKVTPWRRWKVHTLPPCEVSHDVASAGEYGSALPGGFAQMSGS